MSEIESLIDMLSKMIVGTVDKRLSSADFDKSSQGVVTAKDGDTYTIAVFGGSYTITTDQAFVIGQKVVVTAPQGNMKNLIVSPGNIGTMQIIDNGIAGVNGRLSNIEEDYDFAFDIVKNMGKQEDQQFMFWFNTGVPTLSNYPANTWTTDDAKKEHVQDLYLDKDSAAAYQFVNVDGQYKWTEIQSSTITAALLRANQAQDTADGKRRVFTYPNNPSPPYDVGDIYVGGTGGDFLVCQKARTITDSYHASDWTKASKYTDDTVANKAVEDAKKAQETADSSMDNWDNIYKKYGSNFEVLDDSINSKVDSSTYGTDKNGVETRLKNTESSIQQLDNDIKLCVTESDFADGGEHSTAVKQGIIDVTQEQIKSSVDNGDIHSAITQTAEGIKSEVVSKDGIISAINLTSEDATISAKRINLSGDVNITNGQVKINGNVITADNIKAGQIMKEVYSFPIGQTYSGGTVTINDIGYTQLLFVFRGWYQSQNREQTSGSQQGGEGEIISNIVTYSYYTATNTMVIPVTTDRIWYQDMFNYPKSYYTESWEYYKSGSEDQKIDKTYKEGLYADKSLTNIMRFFSVQKTGSQITINFKDAIEPATDKFLWISWESSKAHPDCVIPWKIYGIK